MARRALLLLAFIFTAVSCTLTLGAQGAKDEEESREPTYAPRADPERYAQAIAAFEEADRADMPEKGGVLFVGSSSIRRWDLPRWFPDEHVINRGFGGSQIADSIHFTDRIILPYEPRTIIFYAGDNDVNAGMSAEQAYDHYRILVRNIHEALPQTQIVFISIKPSTRRWAKYPEMKRCNELVRAFSERDARLHYVDVEPFSLDEEGKPVESLLARDGLHLSDEGYALWTRLVRRYVADPRQD